MLKSWLTKSNKWFTLVELIVVIVLILLILMSLFRQWSTQIKNTQFRIDRETLVNTHFTFLSNWISSNYYYWEKFDELSIELENSNSLLNLYLISNNWSKLFNTYYLNHSYLSWFIVNWQSFSSWNLTLQSYKIWCNFKSGWDIFTWWKLYFDLISKNWSMNSCFNIDLLSCKLFQIQCID